MWIPQRRITSMCELDLTYFPFDTQECSIKISSWTYDGSQVCTLCMYTYIRLYACVHACMHALCTYVCMYYVCMCVYACMYVRVCMCVCMYVCMYIIGPYACSLYYVDNYVLVLAINPQSINQSINQPVNRGGSRILKGVVGGLGFWKGGVVQKRSALIAFCVRSV